MLDLNGHCLRCTVRLILNGALLEVCSLGDAKWALFDVYGLADAKWALFEVYGAVWLMLNGLCLRCTVQFG